MSALRLPVRQGSPEWLDARKDTIGSSDIPVITGHSPYRSSLLDLWAVKTRLLEPEEPDEDTAELWALGHALEPVIAERYEVKTGRRVQRAMQTRQHPTIPWATASLDRVVVGERRIVELKYQPHRSWLDGPEPVPADVQDQVQWQMFVTGWEVADAAVLSGGKVSIHEVPANLEYQDNLRFLADWFRGFVDRGERPPIDGSEQTRRTLARMYPRDNGLLMSPTLEMDALASQLRDQAEAFDDAETAVKKTKNTIRGLLENYAGVEGDGYRISFRRSKDGTKTAWESVAKAYRTLLEDTQEAALLDALVSLHTTPTEGYRSLLPKWRNEEGKWV